MTCPAAIISRYEAREQIREYLASGGFQRTLEGWRNGRWIETRQSRRWRLLGRGLAADRVAPLTRAESVS